MTLPFPRFRCSGRFVATGTISSAARGFGSRHIQDKLIPQHLHGDSDVVLDREVRNVSMTLRHLRDEISVDWELNRAWDRHVFGRVDPDFGRRV